ncbi:unnamed protein product [Candidula unifasciata]|uniref:Chitin-binding type-2 domain-containing protein n=1 Tax=Candidula unifasciata TaxID=100452 RepID=A0A8S3ZFX5_9EUPU|nr:unnamed protein product [Candidula unifasciata]
MISGQKLCAMILFALAANMASAFVNKCPQPTAGDPSPKAFFYSHPTDNRYFITCAHGYANLMACPTNTFWNNEVQTCTGNAFNSLMPFTPCSGGAAKLIPHATACQRYYNCSQTGQQWNRYFGKYEAECPYPQLFDAQELRCKPYSEAVCDMFRVAAKDPCDYLANKCGSAHCEPCSSRMPSCIGYKDGLYQHPRKLNSPYKMHCVSERLYQLLMCLPQTSSRGKANTSRTSCQVMWQADI